VASTVALVTPGVSHLPHFCCAWNRRWGRIRNGGAAGNELGEAVRSGSSILPPPYRIPYGGPNLTQAVYDTPGGFPSRSDAPAGSGAYVFTGGPGTIDSSSVQMIDLSGAAAAIDAAGVPFRLSGAFGGYGAEDDTATLTLELYGDTFAVLSTTTIGGFTAADRGGVTKLLPDSARGFVPAGTRSAMVTLLATIAAGAYNDGFADDLSLQLPEPGRAGGLCAVAALAAVARRTRRQRIAAAGEGSR
jgi:hypothetical protein